MIFLRRNMPIFYSAIMLTGVNLLLRFVGTTFQVYLSSRIGPAGIGLLQLVMSVGSLSLIAAIAGVRTATMYLTAEELGKNRPQNVASVLSCCMVYSFLCSGSVALALFYFAPWIAQHWIGYPEVVSAIRLLAGFLPANCLCGVMTGYFTAANRIGTLAAVEVCEQFLSLATTTVLLILWPGQDAVRAIQAVILGSCAGSMLTLASLVVLRIREKMAGGSVIPVRSRLLQTAVPLALADDLKAGISTTENLMVPKRLALYPGVQSSLAAFGTVSGMVFPVLMFPAAILFGLAELLIPELARCNAAGSNIRIRYLVKRSLRVTLVYSCIFCGLMYLLAEFLCLQLYDSPEAGAQLRLYALLIPMLYCDAITDAMTKGLGQQKICVRYNIVTSAMDVALLFILLPRYGMRGYFFSFLVTHALNFALSLRLLLRISRISMDIKKPLAMAICTVFSVFTAGLLPSVALRSAAFITILGCLLFLLRVLTKEDLQWLKGLLRK